LNFLVLLKVESVRGNWPTLGSKEGIWSCNEENLIHQSDKHLALPEYCLTQELSVLSLCEKTYNDSFKTLALKSSTPSNANLELIT
jgi:hypothetical protein